MIGYIITAALQRLHTVVHTETLTSHKSQATKDLEDSLSQLQAWKWLLLTCLALSLGCLAITLHDGMEADTPTFFSTETSITVSYTHLTLPTILRV